MWTDHSTLSLPRHRLTWKTGGKVKPLKAAKKDKKDLDDEDKAFLERKKAGKYPLTYLLFVLEPSPADTSKQRRRLGRNWRPRLVARDH